MLPECSEQLCKSISSIFSALESKQPINARLKPPCRVGLAAKPDVRSKRTRPVVKILDPGFECRPRHLFTKRCFRLCRCHLPLSRKIDSGCEGCRRYPKRDTEAEFPYKMLLHSLWAGGPCYPLSLFHVPRQVALTQMCATDLSSGRCCSSLRCMRFGAWHSPFRSSVSGMRSGSEWSGHRDRNRSPVVLSSATMWLRQS